MSCELGTFKIGKAGGGPAQEVLSINKGWIQLQAACPKQLTIWLNG
jgi:hypothetical protein